MVLHAHKIEKCLHPSEVTALPADYEFQGYFGEEGKQTASNIYGRALAVIFYIVLEFHSCKQISTLLCAAIVQRWALERIIIQTTVIPQSQG